MVVMAVTDAGQGQPRASRRSSSSAARRVPRRQEGRQARHARQRDERGHLRELPRARRRSCSATKGRASSRRLQVLDAGRIGIAALAVGLAQGAYEAARGYAFERKQFGQPIGTFQAIRAKLVDDATRIEAARLLTYRAACAEGPGPRARRSSRRWPSCSERDRRARRRGRRADSRRLRLREGLPGREVLPRREAHHHRRGHERDPAARHRAPAAGRRRDADRRRRSADRVLAGDPRAIARAISLDRRRRRRPAARADRATLPAHRPRATSSASPGRPAPARARWSIG